MLPTTQEGVNYWIFTCLVAYILIGYAYNGYAKGTWKVGSGFLLNKLFGGANLGVSSLLAPSLINPNLVALLGQSPLYLTIAGIAGLIIAICQVGSE